MITMGADGALYFQWECNLIFQPAQLERGSVYVPSIKFNLKIGQSLGKIYCNLYKKGKKKFNIFLPESAPALHSPGSNQ